jgi:predicted RNA binding protein YcfA (HicA-like mRNA interferase family)
MSFATSAIPIRTWAVLAAKIIGILDQRKFGVRAAEALTSVAASEFSRIRNVKLERFTIDRMITILGKLGQDVELGSAAPKPRVTVAGKPSDDLAPGTLRSILKQSELEEKG